MPSEFSVRIKKAEWLNNPPRRWNNGLLYAGNAWRAENQDYPAQAAGSTYKRTGTLGGKSNFEITDEGREMLLKSVGYWQNVMYGTGVFGPKSTPITPKTKRVLAWKDQRSGRMIFAKSVQGFIWEGKLKEIIAEMKKAFKLGIVRYVE